MTTVSLADIRLRLDGRPRFCPCCGEGWAPYGGAVSGLPQLRVGDVFVVVDHPTTPRLRVIAEIEGDAIIEEADWDPNGWRGP